MDAALRCPCGSGDTYGECCARLHTGTMAAPSAEALMRSRFSAFAVGDADYLLASWHASTRPEAVELDARIRWTLLEIVGTAGGGPFDRTGVVEFRGHYRLDRDRGVLHERSEFVRTGGGWSYVRGAIVRPPMTGGRRYR